MLPEDLIIIMPVVLPCRLLLVPIASVPLVPAAIWRAMDSTRRLPTMPLAGVVGRPLLATRPPWPLLNWRRPISNGMLLLWNVLAGCTTGVPPTEGVVMD